MKIESVELNKIEVTKEKLNSVSKSFCLAKWKQVTILLHNGTTHSCAHPAPHKIPLEEIKENPAALHNTQFKIEQRKKMLQGVRPAECQYCWNIEDSGQHYSDRHIKSSEYWARDHFETTAKSNGSEMVNPSYLEVSFSNTCQLKCSYCFPQVSSKWMKEIQEFGAYHLSENNDYHNLEYFKSAGLMPIEDEKTNPYIDAFWEWLPNMYQDLKMLRITGGEPLLSSNTFKLLDWIDQNSKTKMNLAINSNLSVADLVLDQFIKKAHKILNNEKITGLDIFTSVDTFGTQAEYIRHGLNYDKLMHNIVKVLDEIPAAKVAIMCTYNAMSVYAFRKLLENIFDLRRKYRWSNSWRLFLDIGYLRYPPWQSVQILNAAEIAIMKSDLEYMKKNRADYTIGEIGFYDLEIEKMSRLISWAELKIDPTLFKKYRKDFKIYFTEQDRRRGTNFIKTFPEMKEFWSLADEQV